MKTRTSPTSPRIAEVKRNEADSSACDNNPGKANEAIPTASSTVTITAQDQRDHCRRAIRRMLELICSASMGAAMGIGCCCSDCVMGPRDCVYPLETPYCGSAKRSHKHVSTFSIRVDSGPASNSRRKSATFPVNPRWSSHWPYPSSIWCRSKRLAFPSGKNSSLNHSQSATYKFNIEKRPDLCYGCACYLEKTSPAPPATPPLTLDPSIACSLFALSFQLPSFVFNRLPSLSPKHPE